MGYTYDAQLTAYNLVWHATGYYLAKTTTFRSWSAVLEFRNDQLAAIAIDARFEDTEPR